MTAYMVHEIESTAVIDIMWRHMDDEVMGKYGLPNDPSVRKVMDTIMDKLSTILPEAPTDAWLKWDGVIGA